jgi:hypothetical protein
MVFEHVASFAIEETLCCHIHHIGRANDLRIIGKCWAFIVAELLLKPFEEVQSSGSNDAI